MRDGHRKESKHQYYAQVLAGELLLAIADSHKQYKKFFDGLSDGRVRVALQALEARILEEVHDVEEEK